MATANEKSDQRRFLKTKIYLGRISKGDLYKTDDKGWVLETVTGVSDELTNYEDNGYVTQDVGYEKRKMGHKGPIIGSATWIDMIKKKQHKQPDTPASVDDLGLPL